MKKGYYVLITEGDTEPLLVGPFRSDFARDQAARREKAVRGDRDGIFWMNTYGAGIPAIGTYQDLYLSQLPEEVPHGCDAG